MNELNFVRFVSQVCFIDINKGVGADRKCNVPVPCRTVLVNRLVQEDDKELRRGFVIRLQLILR
jgi:hypothetical protein